MGVFTRSSGMERRQAFPEPIVPTAGLASGGMGLRSVNLTRTDAAMQKVAVFAAVNLLASIPSMVPFNVYSGVGQDKRPRTTPAWMTDIGGTGHGTSDFLWQVLYCWGLRGNAIGRVLERDSRTGLPTTIDLWHPDDVKITQDPNDPTKVVWRNNGTVVPNSEVWHRRVYPTPGRVMGLSPIALHAVTIGQGLYAQNFGAQWFLDGAHPSSILTNDKTPEIDQQTANTVKARFLAAVRGTREPVVLGGGWQYKQIQIAPAESQFLETQEYTAGECARIYGPGMPEILGYKVGNSMTYANIEQRSVDLLTYTIDPWLVRVERLLSELLPAPQFVKFDRKALLRTDTLTRFQKHRLALLSGVQTINEIRTVEEDMAPVPWGDEPFLPSFGPAPAAAAIKDDSAGPEGDAPAADPPALVVAPKPPPQGGQQP